MKTGVRIPGAARSPFDADVPEADQLREIASLTRGSPNADADRIARDYRNVSLGREILDVLPGSGLPGRRFHDRKVAFLLPYENEIRRAERERSKIGGKRRKSGPGDNRLDNGQQ